MAICCSQVRIWPAGVQFVDLPTVVSDDVVGGSPPIFLECLAVALEGGSGLNPRDIARGNGDAAADIDLVGVVVEGDGLELAMALGLSG